MTSVLFKDKDKENKLKQNKNNIVNYLNISDSWDRVVIDSIGFNEELLEIKKFNLQTYQILKLYELLGGDINEDEFDKVKEEIKKDEEMNKQEENIKQDVEEEKENIGEEEDESEKNEEAEDDEDDYYRWVRGVGNDDTGRDDDDD